MNVCQILFGALEPVGEALPILGHPLPSVLILPFISGWMCFSPISGVRPSSIAPVIPRTNRTTSVQGIATAAMRATRLTF